MAEYSVPTSQLIGFESQAIVHRFNGRVRELTGDECEYCLFQKPHRPYVVSATHAYEWLEGYEEKTEDCEEGSVKMSLSERMLHVSRRGEKKAFPLHRLRHIDVKSKRLMFPVLTGGILSPLLLYATLEGQIYAWTGIILSFLALLYFYYGWLGHYEIRIMSEDGDYRLAVERPGTKWEKFTERIREYALHRKRNFYG